MQLRQNELLGATAVGMYIVFFALSPPDVVRKLLANPFGMAAVFAGSVYVALYQSKLVGGLLIAAFVISMTRVTEHLTVGNVTIADGETYKCAEGGEHGLVEGGKLRAFANREIGKSYDSNAWTGNVKVISCAGSGNIRGTTIRTPKPAAGAATGAAGGSGTAATPPAAGGGRTYTGTFNPTTYLAANPDVAAAINNGSFRGSALDHWNNHGKNENRSGSGQTLVTGGGSGAGSGAGAGAGTGTGSGAGAGAGAGTGTGSGAGAGTGTGSGAGAGTGTGSGAGRWTAEADFARLLASNPNAAPPGSSSVPVRPVMSCNLENFAPF